MLSSLFIKTKAQELGFFACGMAPAAPLSPERIAQREAWLKAGCHGDMSYLERNEDKRRDPRLLVEGVQTIISLAMNYYTYVPLIPPTDPEGKALNKAQIRFDITQPRKGKILPERYVPIARYARGKDYHDVMKERLFQLLAAIGECVGMDHIAGSRVFVDTAPVDERYWATRCGLGWQGKNTQLIIPGAGSYFFLGEIFLTLPVDQHDSPIANKCGNCTACLKSCPANALDERGLDARKCLSYLTIEHREDLPKGTGKKMGKMFYGCDACADCCPWNRLARPTHEEAFYPSDDLLNMTWEDWKNLSLEEYQRLFKGLAVKRAKYTGVLRNIEAMSQALSEETEM